MAGASGLSLRADQVATILQSVLAATPSATVSTSQITVTATPSPVADGPYTATDMVALGCGLGLPLFLALCAALVLLYRERQKHATQKLMYQLPDSCKEEFTFRPPPIPGHQSSPYPPSSGSDANSLGVSQRTSFRTVGSQKPGHIQNFLERYETMKQKGQVHDEQRHEMDTGLAKGLPRHERFTEMDVISASGSEASKEYLSTLWDSCVHSTIAIRKPTERIKNGAIYSRSEYEARRNGIGVLACQTDLQVDTTEAQVRSLLVRTMHREVRLLLAPPVA